MVVTAAARQINLPETEQLHGMASCRPASASIAAECERSGREGKQYEPVRLLQELGLGLTRHEAMPLNCSRFRPN